MAKKIVMEVTMKGKGIKSTSKNVEKTRKETDKLDKSRQRLGKSTDRYSRREKGVAQMGMNTTKGFSKMQQGIGGEGGAGGLVRAYALLAANVFALSAAFGILSRSAQVDTLIESMGRLEIVSGNAVKGMARELQAAASGGLDFAESMRSTSLALSAGFDTKTIVELGEVAKNAAVSLGRPIADSLDRIFRGVIKVEPELLDEIGLFVRVREASARYASSLGLAASSLTEFQKRQAFAAEAIRQGQEKFQEFSDIDIDAFALLAASFSDMSQEVLTFLNRGLGPMITLLAENKELLGAAFGFIALVLLRKVIPAMGLFTRSIKQQSIDASAAHAKYLAEIKSNLAVEKEALLEKIALQRQALREELAGQTKARRATDKTRGFGGKKGSLLLGATAALKAETDERKKIGRLEDKSAALNKSKRGTTSASIKEEQAALEAEILTRKAILQIKKEEKAVKGMEIAGASRWSHAELVRLKLLRAELIAFGHANIAATAETKGFWAGLKAVGTQLGIVSGAAKFAGTNINMFGKALFLLKGYLVVLQVGLATLAMRLMGFFGWIMLLLPIIMFMGKKLGLWSAAHDKLNAATEKANELSKDFAAKMQNSTQVLADAETTTTKAQQAQLAMERSIRDTTAAIEEQMNALKEFKRDATDFAIFIEKLKSGFDFGGEADLRRNNELFFREQLESFDALSAKQKSLLTSQSDDSLKNLKKFTKSRSIVLEQTDKIVKLEEEYAKWKKETRETLPDILAGAESPEEKQKLYTAAREEGERRYNEIEKAGKLERTLRDEHIKGTKFIVAYFSEILGLRKDINVESTKEAAGSENMLSIQKGAQDALRKYRDTFIESTAVDDPLAIFEQTMDNIQINTKKMVTNQKARDKFLKNIADGESEILDMMTIQNQLAFKRTKDGIAGEQDRLNIIEDTRNEYRRQQKSLIQNKQILAEMARIQKMMNKLTKESAKFAEFDLALSSEKLAIKAQEAKDTFQASLQNLKITESQLKITAAIKDQNELTKALADLKINAQQLFSAESLMRRRNLALLEEELDIATFKSRLEKATLGIALKRLQAEEKLNKANLKTVELQRQIFSLQRRGTTSLSGPEAIDQMIEVEKVRLKTAHEKAEIEKRIIKAQFTILKIEAEILAKRAKLYKVDAFDVTGILDDLDAAAATLIETIDKGLENAGLGFAVALAKGLESLNLLEGLDPGSDVTRLSKQLMRLQGAGGILKGVDLGKEDIAMSIAAEKGYISEAKKSKDKMAPAWIQESLEEIEKLNKQILALDAVAFVTKMTLITQAFLNFADAVKELGPEGNVAASLAMFSANLTVFAMTWEKTWAAASEAEHEWAAKTAIVMQGVAQVITGISSILAADSQAKISNIEQQIAMEKKLDGKSEQSMAKIRAMEVKKEAIAKKAFEINKKLQIANAIISTASGAAQAYAYGGPAGPYIAALITALGLMQVAIIRKTTYQGGGDLGAGQKQQLDIGARNDRVNVARGVSSGELSYLRGDRGVGSNANTFVPGGGAVGLKQGYATGGGVLVGEQGPEIVRPTVPVTVNPNENMMGTTNVNFTIQAVDAAGVEDVLRNQRGNIIGMIREAANSYGEDFLEVVDTQIYQSGGD